MKGHHKIAFENLHTQSKGTIGELGKLPIAHFTDDLAKAFYNLRRAVELAEKALEEIELDEFRERQEAKAKKEAGK